MIAIILRKSLVIAFRGYTGDNHSQGKRMRISSIGCMTSPAHLLITSHDQAKSQKSSLKLTVLRTLTNEAQYAISTRNILDRFVYV